MCVYCDSMFYAGLSLPHSSICVLLSYAVPVARAASRMLAKSPEKMTVLRGDTLVLECLSQGSPVPVVTWYKYGSYLPEKRVEFRLGKCT